MIDVFPTTGREPLRVELFGDEIEQIRAFSPFTQRALRQVETATVYPAAERRHELVDVTLPDDELEDAPQVDVPTDLVPPLERAPDFVWSPDEVRSVWADEGFAPIELAGATELAPLPQGQPFSFDAQRPAIAARGLSEAENELNGLLKQELDIVVAFPHRGEALRQQALLRRSTAHLLEPGEHAKGSGSPSRLHGAASSGATSASRCCRTRRSSASARRARRRRRAARCRASPTCARATTSSTRTTASRS